MSKLLVPLLASVAFGACAADTSERSGPVVRDSAGIRIVENTTALWQPDQEWRLGEEPVVDIGGGDTEEQQLFRVRGVARLSDGRIALADFGSQELRFYHADGKHQMSVGGRGDGPGEFQFLNLIGVGVGDTIWMGDLLSLRLSTFAPSGEFVRSVTLDPFEGRTPSSPTGLLSDGSVLAVVAIPPPRQPSREPVRVFADYVQYSASGSPSGAVIHVPLSDHFVQAMPPELGSVAYWNLAFGRTTTVRVRDDRVFIGEETTYEIRILNTAGEVQEIIRADRDLLPVTEEDIRGYRADQLVERRVAEMPFPTHMPAYNSFLVDADGGLWIEEYNRPGDIVPRWTVFDPDGVLLGTVPFPTRFSPRDIGPDYVLGVWRDADDVEHVQLYDLIKPVQ